MNDKALVSHWEAVEEGAARAGRIPKRSDWRIVRDVFVGETDAQARKDCLASGLVRATQEYLLPLYRELQFTPFFKHDNAVPDEDVTPEYLIDHSWLVGSPRTVVEKVTALYRQVGGFGGILMMGADCADNPAPWLKSLRLMAEEVMPHLANLTGDEAGSEARAAK
jgi:alkanesulfonate monooxygenase SsuD/methylene tetrahydromethanopterin reductase-like flavin-dependent oxidoreductase (luciferase family)